ncbi:Periodic tryptophan protein 2 [Neolecta irregularis DAH-3]|uniref:Periodic tryptophan protein 2 n=1 Tax=Neolecta irregularis (strain DAH-3) TaxID=1198029 RepID=A0A1U7LGS0_NEOID|nr:Periodic tryptophan protein 2 [Neolecta irregularis DAH-3]|eukprot:OLL21793.1 Periodic tryptophan protein 2 [Neolecta irregularis DAH-3]
MKSDFKFSNLLGSVYTQGNLVFTPDGTTLLSPVGNRISSFDLVNNTSFTFSFENRRNVERIALSPQATLLLSVDENGRALLVNYVRRVVLHHFNFKEKVQDIQFAPDARHFAVALGRHVQVWKTPSFSEDREFAPFVKHRQYTGCHADVTSITWSTDSRFFIASSKDLTARIFSLDPTPNFTPTTLSGHHDAIICAFFSKDQECIYTVSRDGALFRWNYKSPRKRDANNDQEELDPSTQKWMITGKHYFQQTGAKVRCAAFHLASNVLVVGFSTGLFGLYELPSFTVIHTLSISQNDIDNVVINKTGEWLAFGSSKLGQLLVWEWQSESYILKQQGHFDAMNALAYSNDGQRIVTASDDGKLKLWDTRSGFCIVTFTEHTAGIEAVEFAKRGTIMFSASLDGSLRAWDLIRYRNFRTFTATSRLQFSCLAVDPSGEVVCAGSIDSFDIHIWSVQTGQLLDRLAGHEGPVSSLSFSQAGGMLVSGSWDRSIRVWDVFGRSMSVEPLHQQSDVLAIAVRPDGKIIAVATLDGQLSFWDINNGVQVGLIDGRKDISGGRKLGDKITSYTSAGSKAFRSLCYTADGSCIIAGGNSKYVCIYDVESSCLVKKFTISTNLSLDGTQEKLNSKNLTEAGPLELIDQTGDASDLEDRIDNTLPGATRGDLSRRRVRPEIRASAVRFSPTGRSFAVASTEGLLIYSLDDHLIFDPFDLEIDITPSTTLSIVKEKEYLKALVMSFRLNEPYIIHQVYESIPPQDIQLVAKELPEVYLRRLLQFISKHVEESPHVEFHLLWIEALLTHHGRVLKEKSINYGSELRNIQKCVGRIQNELARLSDSNSYALSYILEHQKVVLMEKNVDSMEIDNDESSMTIEEDEGEWQGFA